jgi:hypothetical protein
VRWHYHARIAGDFHWKFTLTPAAAGPAPRCVWDLTSTSHLSHHPLLLRPGRASRIELQRRRGMLTLVVDDGEPTLMATKERPEGRIGLELPLHATAHTLGPGELLPDAARG